MTLPDTETLNRVLIYWIEERDRVHCLKASDAPKPWSNDPIFQTTRFCNVRREQDKVTIWIKDNWRNPYEDHPNLAFAMCLARVVNWPPTLKHIGFPLVWNSPTFVHKMDELQTSGKVWGGAYMVTGGYSAGGESKQVIIGRVLNAAYKNTVPFPKGIKCEEAFNIIQATPGLGTFLSAQVIADLKYTPLLDTSPDWQTFCAPGPGSIMGLNFLHGRPPTQSISHKRFIEEVNDVSDWLSYKEIVSLTAHDTQNCLCEFSKYVRIKYLGGRAKNGYNGTA